MPRPRSKPQPPRSYHHGNLRRALLDAALVCVEESGTEGFSLRDATRRSGVSPAAAYRHFRNKDALMAAVAGECVERLGAVMVDATAREGASVNDILRSMGMAYIRFAVQNPAHFRVMHRPGMATRVPPDQEQARASWATRQRELLRAAWRPGEPHGPSFDARYRAALCAVHGLAHMIVSRGPGYESVDEVAAERLAEEVTQTIADGLFPGPAGGSECSRTAQSASTT